MEKEFICTRPEELDTIAGEIIAALGSKKIVALAGEMGAGKTTLIQSLCRKLNVTDTVTSPTFAIMNEYATWANEPVYHFDFYRIDRISEAFDLGYEQFLFSNNFCFIEWPEKITTLLPPNFASVRITVENGKRKITLTA